MKKIIISIFVLLLLNSCATRVPYIWKTDGTFMTKKEFHVWSKKSSRKAWKSLSKEEKGLLLDTKVKFRYNKEEK